MRFIDLKKAENNNQIKGISVVCRHRVIWEKPRKQSEPIQCHRCQGYGHTKAYCSRHYIYRECGENHPTAQCKLEQDEARFCFHCGGPHAANFKGCKKYLLEASNRKNQRKVNEPSGSGPARGPHQPCPPAHMSGKPSFENIVRGSQPVAKPAVIVPHASANLESNDDVTS